MMRLAQIAVIGWTVLGASTCALAQTATATRRDPQPEIRYPLGKDSLPQDGVPEGKLEGPFLHQSKIIADTIRKFWVYIPSQYRADKPAALLVFQDGARAINPEGVIRAPQVLENLIAKKQIPVTIGIFITPGQRGSEFPDSIGTGNPNNRDREYDVLNDAYARMLIEEIIPKVEQDYAISSDPKNRTIGGSSSGAICAFTVAWERPEAFRNVVSFIGSYTDIHGGHVYPDLVLEADNKPIRIFLQDGVNDLRSPQNLKRDWHIQNQKMVAAFERKGYDMAYVFGDGGHSDDHGGAMLPEMLRWVWRDHPDVQPSTDDLVAQAKAIQPNVSELFNGFDPNAETVPTGDYAWESRRRGTTTKYDLSIVKNDESITGSLTVQSGDQDAVESEIKHVEMQGNKVIFDVTASFRDREFTTTYHGIVSPSGINGWRVMDFGGQARDVRWSANRK